MKKYTYEVTYNVTAYVEVEADTEEEAEKLAYEEAGRTPISEMKEWKSEAELQKATEKCEECCEEFDVDIQPLHDYQGIRLCEDCIEWAKENPKDFKDIFGFKLNK